MWKHNQLALMEKCQEFEKGVIVYLDAFIFLHVVVLSASLLAMDCFVLAIGCLFSVLCSGGLLVVLFVNRRGKVVQNSFKTVFRVIDEEADE